MEMAVLGCDDVAINVASIETLGYPAGWIRYEGETQRVLEWLRQTEGEKKEKAKVSK